MVDVPADGQTLGEVMFRGNVVMKGYLKNKKATDDALQKLLSQLNKTQTPASNPLGTGGGLGGGNPLGNSGLGGNQGGGTPLSQTKPQTTSDEPKKLVEDKKQSLDRTDAGSSRSLPVLKSYSAKASPLEL